MFFIELKNPDLQLALIFPRNISLYMVFSLAADGANDNYNQFVQFAILHFSPNSFSSRGSYLSWGVRVRRFCGFVVWGAVTQGVVGGVVWCV